MEEDDNLDNGFEPNEERDTDVTRFEEMIRNKDHYFFDVDALIKILDFYVEKGFLSRAAEASAYASKLHPDSANLLLKQAHLFALTGNDIKALETLDRVERLNPFDPEMFMVRGNVYNSLGRYEDALNCFKSALPLSEFGEEVLFSMAITYQNMQHYEKAATYFKKALARNPNYELAMEELTACLALNGKLQEGIDVFRGLIDNDPYSHAAWYHLGDTYCRLGSLEEALNAFDYCILIKDDFAPAHLDKAHVLAMLGEYEGAINKYIQTFEYYNPDGITYFNIAECYEKLEKMDDARTYYKKAVKMVPDMSQGWYGIALTLEYEERWYEAIHYVRKAIEKEHTNPEYWLLLADCEFNLNNISEAGDIYSRIVEEFPSHIDAWLSYAHFLTETGNPDLAVEATQQGLSVHPHCAELLYRQTVNLYAAGRIDDAYEHLAMALDRDDKNYLVIFELMPSLRNDRNIIRMIASKSDI